MRSRPIAVEQRRKLLIVVVRFMVRLLCYATAIPGKRLPQCRTEIRPMQRVSFTDETRMDSIRGSDMLAPTLVVLQCVARVPLSVIFPRRATHPICSTLNRARMPLDVQQKSLRRPPHPLWLCPQWLLHVSPPIRPAAPRRPDYGRSRVCSGSVKVLARSGELGKMPENWYQYSRLPLRRMYHDIMRRYR